MSCEAIMDRRGRVTLPKPLREALSLKPGTRINFVPLKGGPVTLHILPLHDPVGMAREPSASTAEK